MVKLITAKKMRSEHISKSADDIITEWVSNVVILLLAILCLYPYLNIVAKSFSGEGAVLSGEVRGIFPKDFNLNAYKIVLFSLRFQVSFINSVIITVVGTLINILLTTFVAYGVSRKDLPGSKLIIILYIFTMLFSGGLIPTYLIVVKAGLRNTIWALIIPTLVTPFYLIIMRNFMEAIPSSLEESAKIDGAGPAYILFMIIIPLSKAAIATIALFCAVRYWNSYFEALIYIDDRNKYPLQVYLREVIMNSANAEDNLTPEVQNTASLQSVRGATVLASTLPIIIIYPFLQKYFVKGVNLGAVKG